METVKSYFESEFIWYGLEDSELDQALSVMINKISNSEHGRLAYKESPDVPIAIRDCWGTDVELYTKETLDYIVNYLAQRYLLEWCIVKINSMK